MTTAPKELKDARALLINEFDMHPGRVVGADLDPAEVGIVGDTDHVEGGDSYHLGKDQLRSNASYSVRESPRDSRPDNDASALDVGTFAREKANLKHFSLWLVAHCKSGTAFTRNIREVIYSPDGTSVKRWDRLGRRSTGDSSHRTHTHISFFRDSNGAGALEMVRQYLYETGIWERPAAAPKPEPTEEEDDMLSQTLQVPMGFAFDEEGTLLGDNGQGRGQMLALALEPAGIGGAWAGKKLYLSASTDMIPDDGSVKIRVAVFNNGGWSVSTYNLTSGARVSLPAFEAKGAGAFNVTIGRQMTHADDAFLAPIGFTWTIV